MPEFTGCTYIDKKALFDLQGYLPENQRLVEWTRDGYAFQASYAKSSAMEIVLRVTTCPKSPSTQLEAKVILLDMNPQSSIFKPPLVLGQAVWVTTRECGEGLTVTFDPSQFQDWVATDPDDSTYLFLRFDVNVAAKSKSESESKSDSRK